MTDEKHTCCLSAHASRNLSVLMYAALVACLSAVNIAHAGDRFTLAVIGDQQHAVSSDRIENYNSFTTQTDWLAENALSNNIRFVAQMGDIVNSGSDLTEYERANAAMSTLDKAVNADAGTGVPWNVAFGNHEVTVMDQSQDPAGALADNYRHYFGGPDVLNHRYTGQVGFAGVSQNELNTYHYIKSSDAADAREYLMLNLEFDVPGHQPGSMPNLADVPAFDAVAWAQSVINANPGMPTIINTHVFEGTRGGAPNNPNWSGPGRNSQLEIFDKLVADNTQVFMVLSGHTTQDTHRIRLNSAGLPVLQMVTDFSFNSFGGGGFMRLIELDESNSELRVQTFSPGIPQRPDPEYRTGWPNEFTLSLDWESRFDVVPEPVDVDPWVPEPPETTLLTVPATGVDDVSEGGYTVASEDASFRSLVLNGTNASETLSDTIFTFKLPDLGEEQFLSADLRFNLWGAGSISGDAPFSDLVGLRVSDSNVVTAADHQALGTTLVEEILHPWELTAGIDEDRLIETGNGVDALNNWLRENYVAGEYAVMAIRSTTPPRAPLSWFGIDALGIDLTIHAIPEPSTGYLFAISVIGLCRSRGRTNLALHPRCSAWPNTASSALI
ncbi:MAG: hypothetical protein AAGD11_06545 [Planctomycetota bacterium]